MKPYKIVIVDDNEECGEVIQHAILTDSSQLLSHLHRECTFLRDSNNNPATLERILKANPDLLVMDLELSYGPCDDLAKKIKEKRPTMPIFLISGYGSRHTHMIDLMNRQVVTDYGMHEHKIVSVSFDKPLDTNCLLGAIRDYAFAPVSVGFIGGGNFAVELVRHCEGDENITDVKCLVSQKSAGRFENFIEYYEKFSAVRDLDSLMDQDLIVICTSAIHGNPESHLAPNGIRADLLDVEGPKIYEICESLYKKNYSGLVVMVTNPIGLNMRLGVFAGLSENQITAAFNTTIRRFSTEFKRKCKKFRAIYEDLTAINLEKTIGMHGGPVEFRFEKSNQHLDPVFQIARDVGYQEVGENANRSYAFGKNVMIASSKLGVPYFMTVKDTVNLFHLFAQRRPSLGNSAYSFFNDENIHIHFLGMPARAEYLANGIRIYPKKLLTSASFGDEMKKAIKIEDEKWREFLPKLINQDGRY
jgi:CheY-like chemotaxis protein